MRTIIAAAVALTLATPAFAQSGQGRSTRGRVAWTLAGIGIGFGAGMYVGFSKFDQATYAERKITTTAIGFAAAGGIVAFLLTRPSSKPSPSITASCSAALQGCPAAVGRPEGLRYQAPRWTSSRELLTVANNWRQPFRLYRP